jgi:hypothetical protein
MTAFIQQPNFIPWLGYFSKIATADSFIFLDSVALSNSNTWTSRSQILVNGKTHWLSLPIHRVGRQDQKIYEVELLDFSRNWQKTLQTIHHTYKRATYFEDIFPFLENFEKEKWIYLADFNCQFIETVSRKLGITTQFVRSSSKLNLLNHKTHKTDYLIEICKTFKISTYMAGQGGSLIYLEQEKFGLSNIKLHFHNFNQEKYSQLNTVEFVKGLSILDVLMNCGWEETSLLIKSNKPAHSEAVSNLLFQ